MVYCLLSRTLFTVKLSKVVYLSTIEKNQIPESQVELEAIKKKCFGSLLIVSHGLECSGQKPDQAICMKK